MIANYQTICKSDTITHDPRLQARGIASAAAAMQWGYSRDYWRYPVFDLSGQVLDYRLKAFSSNAEPKYLWDSKRTPRPPYYHAPNLAAAIAAAKGVLYIANGEPSVLAYHAAGIHNVLCWYGEGSVPARLLADLRSLGVNRVLYPHDNDSAGATSAAKVRDRLAGSGIDFEALSLADYVAAKGDFNDLWQSVGFDAERAIAILANLPASALPAPKPEPERKPTNPQTNYTELADAIRDYFEGLPGWKRSAKWLYGRSPFRDDHKASGMIPVEGKLFYEDKGKGERITDLAELARLCGIDPTRYEVQHRQPARSTAVSTYADRTKKEPLAQDSANQAETMPRSLPPARDVLNVLSIPFFANGENPRLWWDTATMPMWLRAATLTQFDVAATRLLEAMHNAAVSGQLSETFTASDVVDISPLSRPRTYEALNRLEGMFVRFLGGDIESQQTTIPKNRTACFITGEPMQRALLTALKRALFKRHFGATLPADLPASVFEIDDLPTDTTVTTTDTRQLAAVFAQIGSEPDKQAQREYQRDVKFWREKLRDTTELPIEPASDDKRAYRAAILAAYLAFTGSDTHYRRDLARVCGCCENSLDALYEVLRLKPETKRQPVALEATSAAAIRAEIIQTQKTQRGKVIAVNSAICSYALDDTHAMAAAVAQGETLTMTLQTASKLRPMTAEEIAAAERKSKSEPTAEPVATDEPTTEIDRLSPMAKNGIEPRLFTRLLHTAVTRLGFVVYKGDIYAATGELWLEQPNTRLLIEFVLEEAKRQEENAA